MTTSEKRAAMEAEGQPWPECCGEPMLWQRNLKLSAGGRFFCRVDSREQKKAYRHRMIDEGRCCRCTKPVFTDTLCEDHADRHADFMATPQQQMFHRAAQARGRMRESATKGFRPTGVGQAVVLTALAEGKEHRG